MDPRKSKRYRDARRFEREARRAAMVRQENRREIDEIDGAFVAEGLGALPEVDTHLLAVLRDYLRAGLRMSPRLREIHEMMVEGHITEPGEEREAYLDMLQGAVGTLRHPSRKYGYGLLERRDAFLAFATSDKEWDKVTDLLDQALKRGVHAFEI